MKKTFWAVFLGILLIAGISCQKKENLKTANLPNSFKVIDIEYGISISENQEITANSINIVANYTNNSSEPVRISGKWYFPNNTVEEIQNEKLNPKTSEGKWLSLSVSFPWPKNAQSFKIRVEVKAEFPNAPIISNFEKEIALSMYYIAEEIQKMIK